MDMSVIISLIGILVGIPGAIAGIVSLVQMSRRIRRNKKITCPNANQALTGYYMTIIIIVV